MADRVILTIGTKKGVFVAEAAKPRRSFALRGSGGSPEGIPKLPLQLHRGRGALGNHLLDEPIEVLLHLGAQLGRFGDRRLHRVE